MTIDAAALVTALRLGDSQFPSGAFAFSWGLEVLCRERRVRSGSLLPFVQNELEGRWAISDRVFIGRAMMATDTAALRIIDDEADAMAWPSALREGSCRAGKGLLASHVRIGTSDAAALLRDCRNGKLRGHLPVYRAPYLRHWLSKNGWPWVLPPTASFLDWVVRQFVWAWLARLKFSRRLQL